jgi:signal peptidase I
MKKSKKIFSWLISLVVVFILVIFINSFFYKVVFFKKGDFSYIKNSCFLLLSKTIKLKMNDIIFMKQPFLKENIEIYGRCIGLPNDTILIKNTKLFVNKKEQIFDYDIYYKYRVNCFSDEANDKLINNYKLIDSTNLLGEYYLNLTEVQAKELEKDELFTIKQILAPENLGNIKIFPQHFLFRWNEDNFGQYIVPFENMKIEMNETNFALYRNTIIYFEKKQISQKDNGYFINEQKITDYTFENNYYFILNDDRSDIEDSRIWGAIPEYLINTKLIKSLNL